MSSPEPALPDSTCWSVIHRAAHGASDDRSEFARRYEGLIRAYLSARWQHPLRRPDIDDGVQEVFVECFKEGGVLARTASSHPESFRGFLKSVTRNVALRFETARARAHEGQAEHSNAFADHPARQDTPSRSFDRAWAHMLLDEAVQRQQARERTKGDRQQRRSELLRLRFAEGLPIREIARRFGEDVDWVHHEYARARRDFRAALLEVLQHHLPNADAAQEWNLLAELLGPPEP
ncbi:MAG: sigma-70 family RNA polymerase sigma factor [Planctomycetes bacterium]|nr:sigma-70 family RNA polymerase sigma factor [Planctomycetota bacterium]